MNRRAVLAVSTALLFGAVLAWGRLSAAAPVPSQMTVQGKLTNSSGIPPAPGFKLFTFKIFDAQTGGSEVWPAGPGETQPVKTDTLGLWTAQLGAITPLTDTQFASTERWLQITVDDGVNPPETLSRLKLNSNPFAFRSATSQQAETALSGGGWVDQGTVVRLENTTDSVGIGTNSPVANLHVIGSIRASDKANIGPGNANPGAFAFVAGSADTAGGHFSTVGGGELNVAAATLSTIGGGNVNRVGNEYGTIGGGSENTVTGFVGTIAGGRRNAVNYPYGAVGGGYHNYARAAYSVVAGGGGESDADSNSALGTYSAIGGGRGNIASGMNATVGGGHSNIARGPFSVVAGGGGNDTADSNVAAANQCVVSGGRANIALGLLATVGGGSNNTASGIGATVAGGATNTASGDRSGVHGGENNLASGYVATVAGGGANEARGFCATVGGGDLNIAGTTSISEFATVPGGHHNTATGNCSFAAGQFANASHNGCFVWSDYSSADEFLSTTSNEFSARCTGGARFVSAVDALGNPTAGVQLAAGGGSWSSISDRNAKENVESVDGATLLAKLAAIPVAKWNYKSQDPAIRHIGPMAQDFYAAFGVGEDDKHITTIDADGVALAAIQALYEQQRAENQELRNQIAELRELIWVQAKLKQ